MVVHREKRWSNASSRGIKSDRSTIQFKRATQPVSKVGRGLQPSQEGQGNLAGASQDVPGGSSRDPSTDVERRLRPRPRVSTAPQKCPRTFLHDGSNVSVEPASSRSRGRKTSRRTPRHHGRRRDPQPKGWTVSDEEAGAERSEALSLLASSQNGTTRAAANEQGFRSLGCRRTACAKHPPREQSRGRRTSKGAKAQKG